MSQSKILFFMSGSIAGFKACALISQLVKDGHEVQVVATPATFQFVGAATLEGLTGKKVLSDIWERGHAMDHIHLTRWADFGVLCPASANTIARMSHGLTDDLVSAMALAWPKGKPFTIVPAMNHEMMESPVTVENLERLARRGFTIAPTQAGAHACGEEGSGRMLEPDQIHSILFKPSLGRVLITGGATREPIDGIRFLSNVSTGQTAAALADDLAAMGWQVTYVHGIGAALPTRASEQMSFSSFADLNDKLRTELGQKDYAGVIHCAAVSDYSVNGAQPNIKLSSQDDLKIELRRNFKILPLLKEYSRAKDVTVIGFKLTLNDSTEATLKAAHQAIGASVDAIVANDWRDVNGDRSQHPGTVVTVAKEIPFQNLKSLGQELDRLLRHKGAPHDSLS